MSRKVRVLIVDDSSLVRQMLTDILNECADIEVIGVANDPLVARERIKALNPDVLTLDVEMPRMDGLTFLANLMRLRPMPVLMEDSRFRTAAMMPSRYSDFTLPVSTRLAINSSIASQRLVARRSVMICSRVRISPRPGAV